MRRLLAMVFALSALIVVGGVALRGTPSGASLAQAPRIPFQHSSSLNWSGYVARGATFDSVAGAWVQPGATCGKGQQYAAFWVGLDGNTSSTVEQLGTDADCLNGRPRYYAWYEMYPAASVTIPDFTVVPGNTYSASVSYNATTNAFTLSISGGGNIPFSITLPGGGQARSSAEWIAEAPSIGNHILPLTNFGTMIFSGANSSSPTVTPWDKIIMTDNKGRPKAAPSTLGPKNSFTVTWEHQ